MLPGLTHGAAFANRVATLEKRDLSVGTNK